MKIEDDVLITTARKYGVSPASLKAHVFALVDQGLTRREVRFVLRHLANPDKPGAFAATVRRYERLWREAQGHSSGSGNIKRTHKH